MDAAIAGLLGAAIGSSTSLLTAWVNARYTSKRERSKFIMESASQDRKDAVDLARAIGKATAIPPISFYAHYHSRLFKMLEEDKVSESELIKLKAEMDSMLQAVKKFYG